MTDSANNNGSNEKKSWTMPWRMIGRRSLEVISMIGCVIVGTILAGLLNRK